MEEQMTEATNHEGDNSNVALYSTSAENSADGFKSMFSHSNVDDKTNFNRITTRDSYRFIMEGIGTLGETSPSVVRLPFQVFVAKYNYDPVQYSPNENPEAELTLTAGDYLFIYGEIDEDGFYEGELMNGQRGLVPSNFIEKIPEEELDDLHSVGSENRNGSTDASLRIVMDVEDGLESVIVITPLLDSENSDVPVPKDLHLERQLTNSCVIAWSAPDVPLADQVVESYKVYADGQLVTTVKACDRTKALIEKIDSLKSHKISVRAVSKCGESTDHQCAITIGKGNRLTPSAVDVADITKTSAVVSWTAASSYIDHMVSVEGHCETVTRPGVHRCLITGLLPSVTYTVSITCVEHQHLDHNLRTASVSFVTLPKDFPDPPVDVQVESGPQHGTLLVTWSPVINCGLVMGYCVYANGTKVKELTSPTGDHVVLDCGSLLTACRDPRLITVRTSTLDCRQSHDSSPVVLSQILIDEIRSGSLAETKPAALVVAVDKQIEEIVSMCISQKDERISLITVEVETSVPEAANKMDIENELKQQPLLNRSHRRVPQIEITKDSLSDSSFDNCSEQGIVILTGPSDKDRIKNVANETLISGTSETDRQPDVKIIHQDKAQDAAGRSAKHVAATSHKPRDYFEHGKSSNTENVERKRMAGDDGEIVGVGGSPVDNEPDSLFDSSETEYGSSASQVRIFIALFEYNPATMSPNSGAIEEELPFSEGQLIKVFGDKDADGFYLGEANGLRGLVPCNMVSEVQIDNPDLAEQLIKESMNLCREKSRSRTGRDHSSKSHRQSKEKQQGAIDSYSEVMSWSNMGPSFTMVALYDYDPHELSPNIDKKLELSFKSGDIITVFGDVDYDGFYHGELNRRYGLVPSNFLRPFSSEVRSPHHRLPSPKEFSTSPLTEYQQNENQSPSPRKRPDYNVNSPDVSQRSGEGQEHVRSHHYRHGDHPSPHQLQKRGKKLVPDKPDKVGEGCEGSSGKGVRRSEGSSAGRESHKHKRT